MGPETKLLRRAIAIGPSPRRRTRPHRRRRGHQGRLELVVAQASGLARVTGRPVVAGLVGGIVAGIVGSTTAMVLQAAWGGPELDAVLFVGSIAAFLGGFVAAWPSLNVRAYGAAAARFLAGLLAGLAAGLVAVGIAEVALGRAVDDATETDVGLVAYLWALTAALVGLSIGLLRSPRAAALAFTGGAVAGAVAGALHGAATATFENGVLVVEPPRARR